MNITERIKQEIRGKFRENVSLKDYNTWKIGGFAQYLYEPYDLEDLKSFLNITKKEKITFIGNGSNVLIRDKGVEGYVVCLKDSLNKYYKNNKKQYTFEAGLSCMKIAQITAKNNLTGLEFLCGIPGSLGGALRMNAGCNNGSIWENVLNVTIINKEGALIKKYKKDFDISYRNVNLENGNFFISAKFDLVENGLNNSEDIIKKFLKDRRANQPTGLPSCGSVFKNPKDNYAASLIESLGLKSHRIGGAYISEKHANFIITEKNSKSDDVEDLISHIQKKVFEKMNILLETEVKFIGKK